MAWKAELVRRKWYCINQIDMIYEYKKYLYDEWYNSLTEEQKQRLEEQKRREREKEQKELEASFMRLAMMTDAMFRMSLRNTNINKYGGVYDANGFPNKDFFTSNAETS